MARNTIYKSDNAIIFDNQDGTVSKVMSYTSSTLREISFNELCINVDSILHPVKTIYNDDTVEIIYPKTVNFLDEKLPYEEVFIQGIRLLAILERLKIVHLDFRPENIGIVNGRIVLRDFGNAYLLRSDTGYVSYFRYPVEKIRPPEFIVTSSDDNSRGLRSFIYLQRTFEPATVIEQERSSVIPNLYGSQFDTRADLWSFGCWFHHYLFGVWPEGSFFQREILLQNYGMIGVLLVNILEADYLKRVTASEVANDLEISVPYYDLKFREPEFKHKKLINFTFPDLIDRGSDNGEIISQYSELLLFTQMTPHNNVRENVNIFSSRETLSREEIESFKTVGNLFLNSFYERNNIDEFVTLVTSPPRLGKWTWGDQYDHILKKENEKANEEFDYVPDPNMKREDIEEIEKKFYDFLSSMPDDEEEAIAAEVLGIESDDE